MLAGGASIRNPKVSFNNVDKFNPQSKSAASSEILNNLDMGVQTSLGAGVGSGIGVNIASNIEGIGETLEDMRVLYPNTTRTSAEPEFNIVRYAKDYNKEHPGSNAVTMYNPYGPATIEAPLFRSRMSNLPVGTLNEYKALMGYR